MRSIVFGNLSNPDPLPCLRSCFPLPAFSCFVLLNHSALVSSRVCGREMARAYRREKELKERGEGEGMALRDTIAQEAFSPTSMSSMMMGGVSHDVGG